MARRPVRQVKDLPYGYYYFTQVKMLSKSVGARQIEEKLSCKIPFVSICLAPTAKKSFY